MATYQLKKDFQVFKATADFSTAVLMYPEGSVKTVSRFVIARTTEEALSIFRTLFSYHTGWVEVAFDIAPCELDLNQAADAPTYLGFRTGVEVHSEHVYYWSRVPEDDLRALIRIGFCQKKFYKKSVWNRAKRLMDQILIPFGFAQRCEHKQCKGRYVSIENSICVIIDEVADMLANRDVFSPSSSDVSDLLSFLNQQSN